MKTKEGPYDLTMTPFLRILTQIFSLTFPKDRHAESLNPISTIILWQSENISATNGCVFLNPGIKFNIFCNSKQLGKS